MTQSKMSGGIKIAFVAVVVALFVGSGVYAWQRTHVDAAKREAANTVRESEQRQDELEQQVRNLTIELDALKNPPTENPDAPVISACAYDQTKIPNFRRTATYKLSGQEAFDTVVCGYLVKSEQQEFGQTKTVAYFRAVEAAAGFSASLTTAIEAGNTVNRKQAETIDIRLACMNPANTALVFDSNIVNKEDKIDVNTEQRVLASTESAPINIMFSFETGGDGHGILCNSLANKMTIVE